MWNVLNITFESKQNFSFIQFFLIHAMFDEVFSVDICSYNFKAGKYLLAWVENISLQYF